VLLLRRRISTYIFLFIPGFALASWVTRTPAIRDGLSATTAEMGLLLFGVSIGSMSGILSSTSLVRRFGTRAVILAGLSLLIFGVALIGLGAGASSAPLVFTGLMCFGAGIGSAEVAINIEGAEVEQLSGAPVLVELHGFFSAGTLAGALLGIALTTVDFPVTAHLLAVAGASIPALAWAIRGIEPGFGKGLDAASESPDPNVETRETRPLWKDVRLLMIAVILLSVAQAEGSATDWLPLLTVDGFDLDESSGSLVYAGFAAMMTLGRFGGRRLLEKYGRVVILRGGAVLSAVGVATVIFVDDPVAAGLAATLWGLGISLGFPLSIAAASESGPDSVARVGFVAVAGYVAFLVGPPLLGFLGELFGVRMAMLVVLGVLTLTMVLAPAAGARSATSD
jgi:fucose permease